MNGWKLFLIVGAVVLVHVAVFVFLSRRAVLPDRFSAPPPNFFSRERVVTDEETGERYIHREISVSTRLKDLGPRPAASAPPVFAPPP